MLISPKLTKDNIEVKPNITPNIRGIVFFTPWLKPEWDATILFGPGEQLVTKKNKLNIVTTEKDYIKINKFKINNIIKTIVDLKIDNPKKFKDFLIKYLWNI